MKANELRIGNWVKSNKSGNEFQFTSYHFNDLDVVLTSNPPKPLIEPISLTEEWLIKLGFKTNDKCWYFKGNFRYNAIVKYWQWYGVNIQDSLIKHVHQLQNLYFVLTGEELTFKN